MSEWWLLDARTQDGIAEYLDGAAGRVLRQYDGEVLMLNFDIVIGYALWKHRR